MIVKNEAHGIVRTLESFRGVIDCWTIVDTGSTDGTQSLVRKTLKGIPGEVHTNPFVDFSTTRNLALDTHGERSLFTIMPDSDDYLVDPNGTFRESLEQLDKTHPEAEAFNVNLVRGELSYFLPLVLRTKACWRYTGRVHEYAGRAGVPPASIQIPHIEVRQDRVEQSAEASKARWVRDLALLKADLEADPTNSRTAFYLAQTYECLGRVDAACVAYQHRISLGGWADETFESMLRLAKLFDGISDVWPEVMALYLDAYAFDPRRAEPLYYIAKHYQSIDNHPLAYLFASKAAAIPKPSSTLFVRHEIYDWQAADVAAITAFYVAQKAGDDNIRTDGRQFAEQSAQARPHDQRLQTNLSFYAKSAKGMFSGFSSRSIDFTAEAPYVPLNPSVMFDGKQWRCLVRTVNYKLNDGYYYGHGGKSIHTRNYMLDLTPDLDTIKVTEMLDRDATPRSNFPIFGYEDCRLFSFRGRLWATCTVCDFTDHGQREIALLEINSNDYSVKRARVLRGPWSGHHQKNWMPMVSEDFSYLRFVYSAKPEVVLELRDGSLGVCSEKFDLDPNSSMRGGSQGVRVGDDWLFVVHEVSHGANGRVYLHRFILMSDRMRVTKMSDAFYFQHHGIEFCAGLALRDQTLVASFGVHDSSAFFGLFDLAKVLESLRDTVA